MSPKSFYHQFGGGSISRVSRAFDLLIEYGWLRLTCTETGGRRRGAVEHFYVANHPAVFYDETWAPLPMSMKQMISGGIFEEFAERIRAAMEADTIDAREDRHFSWIPLLLDQEGWTTRSPGSMRSSTGSSKSRERPTCGWPSRGRSRSR